jgi:peptide deformylase
MLKIQFETEQEILIYIEQQKIRQEKNFLSRSEREQLKKLEEKPTDYVKASETKIPLVKPIITGLKQLSVPCKPIELGENIGQIKLELMTTLAVSGGLGLSANQIGYDKQLSYINIYKNYNKETKKVERIELFLINPKIIEHDKKIVIKQEGCLSFPRLKVDTDRWAYITLVNHNDKLEPTTTCYQDWEAIAIQHEIDHLRGLTLLDRKHRAK